VGGSNLASYSKPCDCGAPPPTETRSPMNRKDHDEQWLIAGDGTQAELHRKG
jgi:hypothetical protein